MPQLAIETIDCCQLRKDEDAVILNALSHSSHYLPQNFYIASHMTTTTRQTKLICSHFQKQHAVSSSGSAVRSEVVVGATTITTNIQSFSKHQKAKTQCDASP